MDEKMLHLDLTQGLYHNKVTLSLRLGNQAHNCKVDYCSMIDSTVLYRFKQA